MNNNETSDDFPQQNAKRRFARGAMQAIGGAIPFAGGLFSAIAGAWSEREQEKANRIFEHWIGCIDRKLYRGNVSTSRKLCLTGFIT